MNKIFEETQIWKVVIVILISNVLNYVIAIGLKLVFGFETSIVDALATGIVFILIILWFMFLFKKNKVNIRPELSRLKNDIKVKEFSVVLIFNYALSIGMVLGIFLVIQELLSPDVIGSLMKTGAEPTGLTTTLIELITASILAPISEELVFRGILMTRMKSHIGLTGAILLSSILFGMTHLSVAMLRASIFGVCMCILYLKTKNILVPIVLHMIYNFILTMVGSYEVLFGIKNSVEMAMEFNTTITLIEIGLCIVLMIVSGGYLSKKYDFWNIKQYTLYKGLKN